MMSNGLFEFYKRLHPLSLLKIIAKANEPQDPYLDETSYWIKENEEYVRVKDKKSKAYVYKV